jgi:imidazolonepropionase-like amidohydrolase
MGTDAIAEIGDYAIGLELLVKAGLSPMEVIASATSLAVQSIGVDSQVGTLKPGMLADLVYVEGDPMQDLEAFGCVGTVALNGNLLADKWLERETSHSLVQAGDFWLVPAATSR